MNYTADQIKTMPYVDFMAILNEVNRPPGGKDSIRILVQNTFLNPTSKVLDVGCNTGYCTFEIGNLAKCSVTGIDLNEEMVKSANLNLLNQYSHLKDKLAFKVADGRNLNSPENEFDLVMSGGSTAFISDIPSAIREYAKVVKPWGFIGDVNFFYHTKPPQKLLNDINKLMGTNILPWDIDYWLKEYDKAELEFYYQSTGKMESVSGEKVKDYSLYLARQNNWHEDVLEAAEKRLLDIMSLFNENHKYLGYGVFILRKDMVKYKILF